MGITVLPKAIKMTQRHPASRSQFAVAQSRARVSRLRLENRIVSRSASCWSSADTLSALRNGTWSATFRSQPSA